MNVLLRSASVLALATAALAASAQVYTVSHTFVSTDTTEPTRLFRDGNPSLYPTNVKSYPGMLAGTEYYGTFTLPATSTARVVTAVARSTNSAGVTNASAFFSA